MKAGILFRVFGKPRAFVVPKDGPKRRPVVLRFEQAERLEALRDMTGHTAAEAREMRRLEKWFAANPA
jgi:hypothetical protein